MTHKELLALSKAIMAYQENPHVHQLTCGNNSGHRPLVPLLMFDGEEHKIILVCLDCDYSQTHIPAIDFVTMAGYRGPF